jgi:sugar (pentulose or hexulose) kinase
MRRVGPQPVALVGGATRLHPCLRSGLAQRLGAPVDAPELDACLACARLAARDAGNASP